MWVWMVVQPISLGHWDFPHQLRGRASSARPMSLGPALSCLWGGVGPFLLSVGSNSPIKGRTISLVTEFSKGQGQLSPGQ